MLRRFTLLSCALLLLCLGSALAQWRSMGPYGGNARALVFDPSNPDHILLGSGAGTLFESVDGGRHWKYFAHLGAGHDLMLENVAFDPANSRTIYVAAWSVTGEGGGFFITRDGGRNWSEPSGLRGKSIQALALANTDSRLLIVGALDGLYRSNDRGENWSRITPTGHPDLKNFESVAIDPRDPKIIYAGTWHLPWKTTDGGTTWRNIKQGVIDDSDVFSIIVDQANPQIVFASACSGIYKSENGGELFRKVQGIPGTARRTRVLQQDPVDPKVVYAGTTEGLWKTVDGGKAFKLISPPNFILNDVMIDPRNSKRVLIATDRGGVFASDNAGLTFSASNDGFSQRQITSVVADSEHGKDLYAGVINDKEFGGVFHARDGAWSQMSEGLQGRDVFDLQQSPNGQLVAATNHGLYIFDTKGQRWEPSKDVVSETPAAPRKPVRGKNGKLIISKPPQPGIAHAAFEGRAGAVALGEHRWYAATEAGVLTSSNHGKNWSTAEVKGEKGFFSISVHERTAAAATLREVWLSGDDGAHWTHHPVPGWITRIYCVTVGGDDVPWIATREGALRWVRDAQGEGEWEHVLGGLPSREVTAIRAEGDLLLAAVAGSNTIYLSRNHGQNWKSELAAPYEVTGAAVQGDSLFLATRHHGLLVKDFSPSADRGPH